MSDLVDNLQNDNLSDYQSKDYNYSANIYTPEEAYPNGMRDWRKKNGGFPSGNNSRGTPTIPPTRIRSLGADDSSVEKGARSPSIGELYGNVKTIFNYMGALTIGSAYVFEVGGDSDTGSGWYKQGNKIIVPHLTDVIPAAKDNYPQNYGPGMAKYFINTDMDNIRDDVKKNIRLQFKVVKNKLDPTKNYIDVWYMRRGRKVTDVNSDFYWEQNPKFLAKVDNIQKQSPLGNRYFMKVAGNCKTEDNKEIQRYTVVDNIPKGVIKYPTVNLVSLFSDKSYFQYGETVKYKNRTMKVIKRSEDSGIFSTSYIYDLKDTSNKIYKNVKEDDVKAETTVVKPALGIVPSMVESALKAANPVPLLSAVVQNDAPKCTKITIDTVEDPSISNNPERSESQYVANYEIKNLNPCIFTNNKNPITGATCQEAFQSNIKNCKTCKYGKDNSKAENYKIYKELMSDKKSSITNDIYILLISIFGLYVVKRIIDKN